MKSPHLDIMDLLSLYLLEHPEEEQYIHYGCPDGHNEPIDCMELDTTVRFSAWGVKEGYFLQDNHLKILALVDSMRK